MYLYLYRYTHVEDSPYMMIRLWLCLGLGLIAVFFHEIRPYKVCTLRRVCDDYTGYWHDAAHCNNSGMSQLYEVSA